MTSFSTGWNTNRYQSPLRPFPILSRSPSSLSTNDSFKRIKHKILNPPIHNTQISQIVQIIIHKIDAIHTSLFQKKALESRNTKTPTTRNQTEGRKRKLIRGRPPRTHHPQLHGREDDPFHKDETLPPLVDALQRELTEGTNGSATRRREAANRHRRRQGRVGAEEAAAREAPLLVLPPEPASRHLSACLSPTAGSRPAPQTRSVGAGGRARPTAPASGPRAPRLRRRRPARTPHRDGGGEQPARPTAGSRSTDFSLG